MHLIPQTIIDIICHSMPITYENKMIKQGFNYADSTAKKMADFFETRVEKLEPKEKDRNLQKLPRNPRTRMKLSRL